MRATPSALAVIAWLAVRARGVAVPVRSPRSSPARGPRSSYQSFDWRAQWYPVAWARDCPADAPFKATLLDEDYAVVLRSGGDAFAVRDRCPHRLAALSEGRLTAQGWLQCSYHGFAFDGNTGACRAIPQLPGAPSAKGMCADAVACALVDGLVWINPSADPARPPPVPCDVPELRDPSFSVTQTVRDIPVDYTLLSENIMCADHGKWCHHLAAFDMYAATSKRPQHVCVEERPRLSFTARVDAQLGGSAGAGTASAPALTAQTRFTPPCAIVTGRRDGAGRAAFVQAFFVVPVGVGRSRLISAQLAHGGGAAAPRVPPWRPRRWLQQHALSRRWVRQCLQNDFLDEDSYLIATQQPAVLSAELGAREAQLAASAHGAAQATPIGAAEAAEHIEAAVGTSSGGHGPTFRRRQLFKYRTPSEPLLIEIGRFFDDAVPRMPNRYARPEIMRAPCPPRERVLDRWAQHTAICPESRAVAVRADATASMCRGLLGACAMVLATTRARIGLRAIAVAALLASGWWRAARVRARFGFVHTEARHREHVDRIATVFPDERLTDPA